MAPVVFDVFVSIPLNGTTTTYLQQTLPQIAAANAICLLTVEPDQGLPAVTTSAVQELASYITQYEQVGVLPCSSVLLSSRQCLMQSCCVQAGASFMVRYAQEMNGNWYVWGQQPIEYIASHKLVTDTLRNSTCGAAMVWAPNAGNGYPWTSDFTSDTAL